MINPSPAPAQKFLTPVWTMAAIALIRFILAVTVTKSSYALATHQNLPVNKITLFFTWFFFLMMLAETFIYWHIRSKITNRRWVWAHLALMIIAMVITPLIFIALYQLLHYFFSGYSIGNIYSVVNRWRFYLFLTCIFIGTGFFIAVVLKSTDPEADSMEDRIDAIGID